MTPAQTASTLVRSMVGSKPIEREKEVAMPLTIEGEAKVLGDMREAVRRLLTETPYTVDDLMGVIDQIEEELEEEE